MEIIFIYLKLGGRNKETSLLFRCGALCKCWHKRYMIISDEAVLYAKGRRYPNNYVRETLFFDH